ncbi:la-related protein 7 [Hydra vulgaris]|uniref:la-related protein 7 n=1 Tax=Hydra vulgaris TaxID=6087 RepID=UPI001F5EF871|nr:la-related protein 7 [Hydra vulgaris]
MPEQDTVGKQRKRLKSLLKQTRNQLEFYFSDANLRHDRFLRKEITDNDGYVDLKTMLKFNKLKTLTSDLSVLVKAVEISDSLQLNNDKTKLKRKLPLPVIENVDQKTVYVEQFPNDIDHDWLKEIFSKCGTVEYISLPRHKHNNKVKGFAFIEFSTQQEAEKACQMLNKADKKMKWNKKIENENDEKAKKNIKRKISDKKVEDSKSSGNRKKNSVSECSDYKTDEECKENIISINKNKSNSIKNDRKRYSESEKYDILNENQENKVKERRKKAASDDEQNESIVKAKKKKLALDDEKEKDIIKAKKIKVASDDEKEKDIIKAKKIKAASDDEKEKDIIKAKKIKVASDDEKEKDKIKIKKKILASDDEKEVKAKKSKIASDDSVEKYRKNNVSSTDYKSIKKEKAKINENDNDISDTEKKYKVSSDEAKTFEVETSNENSIHNSKKTKDSKSNRKNKSDSSEILCSRDLQVNKKHDSVQEYETQVSIKDDENIKAKKHRKHKRKEKDVNSKPLPLYVISKTKWLSLKHEYKALQKQNCSQIKKNLKLLASEKVRQVELMERIRETIEAKRSAELTNELVQENKESAQKSCEEIKKPKIEVVLGTVLMMKTDSKTLTRKEIKDSLLDHGVAYVDYIDGSLQGYIRFKTKEHVDKIMKNKQLEKFSLSRLEECAEKAYFIKAEEDKIKNYQQNERKKNKKKERGYDRLTKRIDACS